MKRKSIDMEEKIKKNKTAIYSRVSGDLYKRINLYCAEHNITLKTFVENASELYLSVYREKQMDVTDNVPTINPNI